MFCFYYVYCCLITVVTKQTFLVVNLKHKSMFTLEMPFTCPEYRRTCLTLVDWLCHWDAYSQTVGGLWAVRSGQVLTVRQLEPLQDDGVGAGDDVLRFTQVVL